MSLAQLLQPSMVVIEDIDFIARDRDDMGPCEEFLLNKLLNEKDGLKEDADILFVLTTNRRENLEGALVGWPGRIDQAIEVTLPDEIGRNKRVRLYGKGLPLNEAIVTEAARRSEGTCCAFVKEWMRRLAQASLARDGGNSVISADIDEALDDMLFSGDRPITAARRASPMAASQSRARRHSRRRRSRRTTTSERGYSSFERAFRLPEDVEADKIEALFRNGVFKVTLPKTAEARKPAKKIEIKAA
jgi:SpoVK/Ycf46/Vps4 family AAA+-type ATPase